METVDVVITVEKDAFDRIKVAFLYWNIDNYNIK